MVMWYVGCVLFLLGLLSGNSLDRYGVGFPPIVHLIWMSLFFIHHSLILRLPGLVECPPMNSFNSVQIKFLRVRYIELALLIRSFRSPRVKIDDCVSVR